MQDACVGSLGRRRSVLAGNQLHGFCLPMSLTRALTDSGDINSSSLCLTDRYSLLCLPFATYPDMLHS